MLLEDFLLQRWKVILHILDAIIVHLLDYWPELFVTLQNIILYTISSITYGLTVTVNKLATSQCCLSINASVFV